MLFSNTVPWSSNWLVLLGFLTVPIWYSCQKLWTIAKMSFQTAAPETGNVRLPTVERRTSGTCRRSEQDERSRHCNGMSVTLVKQEWRIGDILVQYRESLDIVQDMFKLLILRKCAQRHAANEGWWAQEWCAHSITQHLPKLSTSTFLTYCEYQSSSAGPVFSIKQLQISHAAYSSKLQWASDEQYCNTKKNI